ncbi:hypothetical protein [Rhodoferax sp. WC2427]|uniref:hypothetical protein n=1 Tax=Rhodoferax sp. WC2427 TaxID=3234144 RepID=UPI003465D116
MTTPDSLAMAQPHIQQLRSHLMDTLADLRNREKPMEPDRARAVAQVASVLIDSAKVEIEYIKATGQDKSSFLAIPEEPEQPRLTQVPSPFPQAGIVGTTRHRLQG